MDLAALKSNYTNLYNNALLNLAEELKKEILDVLSDIPHIDNVSARAKTPESFLKKADKKICENKQKYEDPLNEIQDLIGVRVNVIYVNDVNIAKNKIIEYFKAIESQTKHPENDSEFGYFGMHLILKIPSDFCPDNETNNFPEFFELQIKTLYQHAWSEANHDLGYKSKRELTSDEKRKFAFLAAQSWGADQLLSDLSKSLIEANDN